MKQFFRTLLCGLCFAVILSACSKTTIEEGGGADSPFNGTDNHLTSFVLKVGSETYTATLAGTNINIMVPVNTSLAGAKAEYELCEQATILPDPATITEWDKDQTFRVKSYKGESRDYTYSVTWSEIPHKGNILLLTQADVDAFAKSGATIIDGNLIIGSAATADPETAIVSLEGLKAVKEVKSQIIINNSFSGKDLKGLENIERCSGFYIGNVTAATTFAQEVVVSMPALAVTGDLILNNNSIKSVSMPKLTSVGSLLVTSKEIASIELPLLKEIAADLSVKNPSSVTDAVLTEFKLPELVSVGGSLSFQYFTKLDKAELPKLNYVGGGIDVQLNSNTFEELSFPMLETANGIVNIERAPGIKTINLPKVKQVNSFIFNKVSYGKYPLKNLNLSSLEKIENELYIRDIPMEIISLPALKAVGGNMTLWGVQSMTTLEMPALTQIKGKFNLSNANLLPSLDLSKLTELGAIDLTGCLKLAIIKSPKETGSVTVNFASNADCLLPLFEGLETVTEEFSLSSCSNTAEFNIKNIKKIKTFKFNDGAQGAKLTLAAATEIESLEIGSYRLVELNAPNLAKVGDIKFSSIWSLATINIPVLKTVGNFSMAEHGSWNASNARMTNLDAFAGITSMESVTIEYCGKLADFSGLSQIISGLANDKWSISNCAYNPTYQEMVDGKFTK